MKFRKFGIVLLLGMFFSSCKDTSIPTLGSSVGPNGDIIGINWDSVPILGASFTPQGIPTGDDDIYNMVGIYNDPVFGNTNASFLTQLSISQPVDFGEDPYIDSVRLRLLFGGWYGDSLSLCELEVYQLDNSDGLNSFDTYSTHDYPSSYTSMSRKLGSLIYTAKNLSIPDSIRNSSSYFPMLVVPLDKSLGEEFRDSQSQGVFESNETFKHFFQGIYVKPTMGTRTIMKCQVEKNDASGNTYNSNMLIYFTNEEIYYKNDTLNFKISVADTISDTLSYDLDYDGNADVEIIKPIGTSNWTMSMVDSNSAVGNYYSGMNTYEEIKASEFRTGTFSKDFTMSNTSSTNGQIFWIKTLPQRWIKGRIISISSDSIQFERTIFVGKQAFSFASVRGDAQINFEKTDVSNVPFDLSGANTSSDIIIKGLGAIHTRLTFPSGQEIIDLDTNTSEKTSLINRAKLVFNPTNSYAHKEDIPKYLSLTRENSSEIIPGASVTSFIAAYIDSTNSYSFNMSPYIQYLVSNPDSVPTDLILKVFNDVGDPSGVILQKPENDLEIIYSNF